MDGEIVIYSLNTKHNESEWSIQSKILVDYIKKLFRPYCYVKYQYFLWVHQFCIWEISVQLLLYHIIPDTSNFLVFSLDYPLSSFYPNLMKLRIPFSFLQIIFKEYFYLNRGRWHCFTNWLIKLTSSQGMGERTTELSLHLNSLGLALHSQTFPSPI